MKSEVYWIESPWPGKQAIIPRPRGGDWLEDELRSLREAGLDIIVSLLEPHEETELLIMSGLSAETAFEEIGAARGCPVPETAEQHQWVRELANSATLSAQHTG
jgi:hypothetical protein